jgi:hypothetical protein
MSAKPRIDCRQALIELRLLNKKCGSICALSAQFRSRAEVEFRLLPARLEPSKMPSGSTVT